MDGAEEVELEHVADAGGGRVGREGQAALADVNDDGTCGSEGRAGEEEEERTHGGAERQTSVEIERVE